ncbi:hypothetical protein GCM10010193_16520 [Kitasatospora atroaurantiaca]|uniref:Uncharacterized protein n=1 Tax=Kitasatospora atroaurantiaca TaxID=285545 RepID=A0A561EXF6_9ACTN|nr:hypothetical protein [Kitasatospora atroaurantiaca]TWE20288.1 hypothetical protein FB465_5436 [Kitasatospora atroaurantiaca]
MQSSVAAGGLKLVPWSCLLLGAGWAVGMAALGMTAFAVRTRTHHPRMAKTAPEGSGIEQTAPVP